MDIFGTEHSECLSGYFNVGIFSCELSESSIQSYLRDPYYYILIVDLHCTFFVRQIMRHSVAVVEVDGVLLGVSTC